MERPTWNNKDSGHNYDKINIDDWSGTGRGSHVEFKYGEVVPLEQGKAYFSLGPANSHRNLKVIFSAAVQWATFSKLPYQGINLLIKES